MPMWFSSVSMNFNSRPSARGDSYRRRRDHRPFHFNSRPSARGDGPFKIFLIFFFDFNSRPSARGDVRVFCVPPAPVFQFTPLREGRPLPFCVLFSCLLYFNSRPSARGDRKHGASPIKPGMTDFNSRPSARGDQPALHDLDVIIFQFTPLREGRRGVAHALNHEVVVFQFTPLREGRHHDNQHQHRPQAISIHAPPRGATLPFCVLFSCLLYFNSRPSARGDTAVSPEPSSKAFQFTPLREGRRAHRKSPRGASFHFNSRPSARGDRVNSGELAVWIISIHAPPRGATISVSGWDFTGGFQFTPLREGRRSSGSSMVLILRFQFTPLREGRRRKFWAAVVSFVFQFTPLREGRLLGRHRLYVGEPFQFTPLREGRLAGQTLSESHKNFNSRPSARGDEQRRTRAATTTRRFQFTPLREGRRFSVYHADYRGNFNSRPSARGDGAWRVLGLLESHFNSRPSARGDRRTVPRAAAGFSFQFTPLREGRRTWRVLGLLESHFNSRPSARGDAVCFAVNRGAH